MYKIALINMPFAALKLPSLALTQLKSILDSKYTDQVSAEVLYINHDFAHYLGIKNYHYIAVDIESSYKGLGDWFFRQSAFPETSDNTDIYFQRYFPHKSKDNTILKDLIQIKRKELDQFLDDLIDKYNLLKADLVCFTSMFSQNLACFTLARKIKERKAEVVVIMGGANCESPMGQEIIKNVVHIDFVFSGIALKSFPEFVCNFLNGNVKKCDLIKGVFSKNNYSSKPLNALVGEELSLDVPIKLDYTPFLNVLERNFPNEKIEPILLFETSRGCWWGERGKCTFCGLNGLNINYRAMSSEKALNLIQSLFKYSSRVSRLQSVDNIIPNHYPKEVFDKLDTPANMTIFYEVRTDLNEEDMQILSKARVKGVQPGIEALATPILKLMRKGRTVFHNLAFLKNCVMYDISPDWNLLIGFPGEGEEVYKKYITDIPKLVHLPPPSGAHPVRPDRYSPYYIQAKEYELDLHPTDFYEMVYPFRKESIENIAYFFRDNNFAAEYFQVMVQWYTELQRMVEMWQNLWNKKKGHPLPPMLYFKGTRNPTIIYDTRTGEVKEHMLTEISGQLLHFLSKPKNIRDLTAEFDHIHGFDKVIEVSRLEAQNLIFREGKRVMSLVLPEKPSLKEVLDGWSWGT